MENTLYPTKGSKEDKNDKDIRRYQDNHEREMKVENTQGLETTKF